MQEATTTQTALPIGSPWLRISAFLVDAAILIVIDVALATSIPGIGTTERSAFALFLLASAVYDIGSWIWLSATPGQLLMGLYVTDKAGAHLTPDRAILRYLILFVGGIVMIGHVISLALIFVDSKQRRAIHDRVAGTLVLRVTEEEFERRRARQDRDRW
jgi:uncharacterized RDD family membrane protein YckC